MRNERVFVAAVAVGGSDEKQGEGYKLYDVRASLARALRVVSTGVEGGFINQVLNLFQNCGCVCALVWCCVSSLIKHYCTIISYVWLVREFSHLISSRRSVWKVVYTCDKKK